MINLTSAQAHPLNLLMMRCSRHLFLLQVFPIKMNSILHKQATSLALHPILIHLLKFKRIQVQLNSQAWLGIQLGLLINQLPSVFQHINLLKNIERIRVLNQAHPQFLPPSMTTVQTLAGHTTLIKMVDIKLPLFIFLGQIIGSHHRRIGLNKISPLLPTSLLVLPSMIFKLMINTLDLILLHMNLQKSITPLCQIVMFPASRHLAQSLIMAAITDFPVHLFTIEDMIAEHVIHQ